MLKTILNTIANYAGGMTTLAAMLIFNGIYFRMLDAESYGVVSFLLTASLALPALDLGTGRTVGRLVAEHLARRSEFAGLRDAVLTLQLTNAGIALFMGLALVFAAPWLAAGWLRPESLEVGEIAQAIGVIGVIIVLMMARNFSIALLNGMKRQIITNALIVLFSLLRGIAGLLAISLSNDPLYMFFVSQLLVQVVDTLISGVVGWRLVPPAQRLPRFDPTILGRSWRFSAADGAANLIGASLTMGDKVLLSALLPLSSYGAYALMSNVAVGIGRFTSPFSAAFLPHFVALIALKKKDELRNDFLIATELLASVILPIATIMVLFAPEILAVLIGPEFRQGEMVIAFVFLVTAALLNSMMHLPHGIQLAAGNSVTGLQFGMFNAVAYVVLVISATPFFGITAPAIGLFGIYAATIAFFIRISQQTVGFAAGDWFGRAIVRPGAIALLVTCLARVILPSHVGPFALAIQLVVTGVVGSGLALAACPGAGGMLLQALSSDEAGFKRSSRDKR